MPAALERGQLFRRCLALVPCLPRAEWLAVDRGARLLAIHRDPALRRGFAVPVGEAVAAEAGQDHQVDVLHVGPRLEEVAAQAPEHGGFDLRGRGVRIGHVVGAVHPRFVGPRFVGPAVRRR